jgi:hypothetical protein
MRLRTTSWYKRVCYSKVEQSRSYVLSLLICGLQHFDLVLQMDEVMEFVSPDILGVEWLDKTTRVICTGGHQCNIHLGYQLADDGSESRLR